MIGECGHTLEIEIGITNNGHEYEFAYCDKCNIVYQSSLTGFRNYEDVEEEEKE